MRRILLPSRAFLQVLGLLSLLVAAALLVGRPLAEVAPVAGAVLAALALFAAVDAWRSLRLWRAAPLHVERQLPGTFALGVATEVALTLVNAGPRAWRVRVFDAVDPAFTFSGLPVQAVVPPAAHLLVRYTATARSRGAARFGMTPLRWRTRAGCWEVQQPLGEEQSLRVYPNFGAVARYAWLAGDRRLAQIGIKSQAQRGQGTDFRQLADYRQGDALRHIDWKATLRRQRPTVREFQDERDQCVLFLLDCGRRMRAHDGGAPDTPGTQDAAPHSHFDDGLNALMLLGHVALKQGDQVGAMSFGTAAGEQRHFAPRKGLATLSALMNALHDLQPGITHSDYAQAARDVMRHQQRRALVVVLTNFRDEDADELRPAVRLMRSRHLVMVASLRERALGALARQPLAHADDAVTVASAHLLAQSRRDAFARVVGQDPLSLDVEPAALAVALVNRYQAVKRAGLL